MGPGGRLIVKFVPDCSGACGSTTMRSIFYCSNDRSEDPLRQSDGRTGAFGVFQSTGSSRRFLVCQALKS